MFITDISIKIEELVDGTQGLSCRAKTDGGADVEHGCAVAWRSQESPKYVADALRSFASAIERMDEKSEAA